MALKMYSLYTLFLNIRFIYSFKMYSLYTAKQMYISYNIFAVMYSLYASIKLYFTITCNKVAVQIDHKDRREKLTSAKKKQRLLDRNKHFALQLLCNSPPRKLKNCKGSMALTVQEATNLTQSTRLKITLFTAVHVHK